MHIILLRNANGGFSFLPFSPPLASAVVGYCTELYVVSWIIQCTVPSELARETSYVVDTRRTHAQPSHRKKKKKKLTVLSYVHCPHPLLVIVHTAPVHSHMAPVVTYLSEASPPSGTRQKHDLYKSISIPVPLIFYLFIFCYLIIMIIIIIFIHYTTASSWLPSTQIRPPDDLSICLTYPGVLKYFCTHTHTREWVNHLRNCRCRNPFLNRTT